MFQKKAQIGIPDLTTPIMAIIECLVGAIILFMFREPINAVVSATISIITGNTYILTEWLLIATYPLLWLIYGFLCFVHITFSIRKVQV